MNQHDRGNLAFLLSADKATMDQWFASVSEDDVMYAMELLQKHKTELMLREMELMDDVDDVSEASEALKKFM